MSDSLISVPVNRYDSSGRCTVHLEAPYQRHLPEGTTDHDKSSTWQLFKQFQSPRKCFYTWNKTFKVLKELLHAPTISVAWCIVVIKLDLDYKGSLFLALVLRSYLTCLILSQLVRLVSVVWLCADKLSLDVRGCHTSVFISSIKVFYHMAGISRTESTVQHNYTSITLSPSQKE